MSFTKQLICISVLIGFLMPAVSIAVTAQHPKEDQNFFTLITALGFVSSKGVRIHHLPSNNPEKPDSGPEFSVPATG